jgi:hypothetical protein
LSPDDEVKKARVPKPIKNSQPMIERKERKKKERGQV